MTNLRDEQAAQALVVKLRGTGAEAIAMQADVSREADVERLFRELDAAWGAPTVLVNNAGVVDRGQRFDQTSQSRIERLLAINVVGSKPAWLQVLDHRCQLRGAVAAPLPARTERGPHGSIGSIGNTLPSGVTLSGCCGGRPGAGLHTWHFDPPLPPRRRPRENPSV